VKSPAPVKQAQLRLVVVAHACAAATTPPSIDMIALVADPGPVAVTSPVSAVIPEPPPEDGGKV
jgi:hypothetical protein